MVVNSSLTLFLPSRRLNLFHIMTLLHSLSSLIPFLSRELTSRRRWATLTIIFSHSCQFVFRTQIIATPEVIQVLPELPILGDLVKNLYDCYYDKFFIALSKVLPLFLLLCYSCCWCYSATLEQTHLLPSCILSPHARYYICKMCILAYSQLLELYQSLTLESLSRAFSISINFVDRWVLLYSWFPLHLNFKLS